MGLFSLSFFVFLSLGADEVFGKASGRASTSYISYPFNFSREGEGETAALPLPVESAKYK